MKVTGAIRELHRRKASARDAPVNPPLTAR
jgi:hypothetical protein